MRLSGLILRISECSNLSWLCGCRAGWTNCSVSMIQTSTISIRLSQCTYDWKTTVCVCHDQNRAFHVGPCLMIHGMTQSLFTKDTLSLVEARYSLCMFHGYAKTLSFSSKYVVMMDNVLQVHWGAYLGDEMINGANQFLVILGMLSLIEKNNIVLLICSWMCLIMSCLCNM